MSPPCRMHLMEKHLKLRQHLVRVDERAILADLKVDVRTGGIAAAACRPDERPLSHTLPTSYINRTQVGVKCVESCISSIVLDYDRVSVAIRAPPGKDDYT